MQQFFGIMISALYKLKDTEHKLKHFVVYEEVNRKGPNILQHAFQRSLEFNSKSPVIGNYEEKVLKKSLQVLLFP